MQICIQAASERRYHGLCHLGILSRICDPYKAVVTLHPYKTQIQPHITDARSLMSPEPSWRSSVDRCGIYGSRCWPNVLISLLSNAGCSRPGHMRTDRQSTQLRPAATGHNRSSRACIQGSSCCDIPLTGKIRLLVDVRLSRCGSQFCRATICIRWRPDILHRAF